MKKKICGLYLRVSTEDQAREGFSLPEQKRQLEDFCKKNNLEIYDYCKYRNKEDSDYYDYLIIKEIFDDSNDTYGYRRIVEGLKKFLIISFFTFHLGGLLYLKRDNIFLCYLLTRNYTINLCVKVVKSE